MPGISAARARVLEKLEVDPFRSKTLLPGSMPGISAARARTSLRSSKLEPFRIFRSKTLLPGSMPGISAARARVLEKLEARAV